MRQITLDPPDTPDWHDWRHRCEIATDANIEAVRSGEAPNINKALYSEKKVSFYMDYDKAFRGKCAYCERDVHNQYGDIDHFRPKGRVTNLDNKPITKEVAGSTINHPGYYWLAYDLDNLLLSCIRCNRPNSQYSIKTIGKWDKFPVTSDHAWEPGEEHAESPLLINPLIEDPCDHIIFDTTGILGWHTPKGKMTIDLLGLNEYSLPDLRKERYQLAKAIFSKYIDHYSSSKDGPKTIECKVQIDKILNEYGNFTRYAIMGINDEWDIIKEACRSVLN